MTDAGMVRETDTGWILPLQGRRVTRCIVDFAFTLDFWVSGNDSAFVRIETPFTIGDRDNTTECDPESVATIAPALKLFQCEVRSAVASRTGSLELKFADGQWVSVPPHKEYESWQVGLEGGALLVSQPGGSVAVWRRQGTAPPLADDADGIEDVVLRRLEEITKIPRGEIRPTDHIVRDLRADSDDLSFLFVPDVERELGVAVGHDVWRTVITVQDAVDALRQALRERQ